MHPRPPSDSRPGESFVPTCCARPMSVITVTKAASRTTGTCLTLASCARCGRHAWLNAGGALDRSALIGAVRDSIADRVLERPASLREVRRRMSAFTVLGAPAA